MSDAEKPTNANKKKKPKSSLGKVSAFLIFCTVVLVAGLGGGYFWLNNHYQTSHILKEDKIVLIPSGSGVSRIADILVKEGVLGNPMVYRMALRFRQHDTSLKAGEYLFPAGVTPREVTKILREGKTVLHRVTFAEGLTSVEILDQLNSTPSLEGVVMVTPAEGTLLPETYSFPRGMDRAKIVQQMQAAHDQALDELWEGRAADLPINSKQEAVILASIVEKETALKEERGKVAGVFVNRLKKRMRLQTDPTVVYGITLGQEPLGRPLSRKDLKTPTPYNTYTIYGLPPTPICNPGRESLAAVLNPEETEALYFVADGTGGHAFAKSLNEHNQNVAKWRRIERNR